jgi:hypothetical protein
MTLVPQLNWTEHETSNLGVAGSSPAGTASRSYAGTEKVRAPRSGGMRGIGRRFAQASSGKGGSANRG